MTSQRVQYHVDLTGDAEQQGAQSVGTEAEFLRQALAGEPLLIHGASLARWAETFAVGRRVACTKVYSAAVKLQHLAPGLGAAPAKVLLQRWPELGRDAYLSGNMAAVVAHLAGGRLLGSAEHAAEWLQLRLEAPPELQLALTQVGSTVVEMAPSTWRTAYAALQNEVEPLLLDWLGLRGSAYRWPVPFPLPLRGPVQELVRQRVATGVAEHGFDAFSRWQAEGAAVEVLGIGAANAANWLRQHPAALTLSAVQRLREFLPTDAYDKLLGDLPATLPASPPEQPDAWASWMQREYLPYRVSKKADQRALLPIQQEFAERFLTVYAKALNGGAKAEWLVWQRSAALRESPRLTLMAICDGLSLQDLATLQRHLAQQDTGQRLSDLGSQIAFPALPTITHQAKPALQRGVAPTLSEQGTPLGPSSTQEGKVRAALEAGRPGDIVFWNYVKTDKLYHEAQTLDEARTTADVTLLGLARRLLGLMLEAIPTDVPAQLVITTDHGRLLLESERTVTPPRHFTPEGRAAFGQWEAIPAQGFEIGEEYALLGRTTFGMTQDAAVMWNDQTFRTASGATGHVVCPHGGITPEEVLIPWAVYARDLDFRLPTFEISGKGEAEQPGTLTLRAINPNALSLTVTVASGTLAPRLGALASWTLPAHDVTERTILLTDWPRSADLPTLTLKLAVQAGQGEAQLVDARVALKTEELYTPTTNILDDLL